MFKKQNIGVGKRKEAVARVFLMPGNGKIIINKFAAKKYLQYSPVTLKEIKVILKKVNFRKKNFNIVIFVQGGGIIGQMDAIKLGLSHYIAMFKEKKRKILKKDGFLTRDSRVKERKKYGLKKARKAPQYSKR